MALALADLIALRDSLVRARLAGVLTFRDQNGEAITYRTDSEMARALSAANALIAAAQGGQPVNTLKFQTSKGLWPC